MKKRTIKKIKAKFLTDVFYGSIGFVASIALFLVFYWSLSLNSSIYSLINNTKNEPLYLWSYILLTLGIIILFGVNASLFIFRWRKFGLPKIKTQSSSGLGTLIGVVASACPVCGSALLATVGITAGLAAFPLQGLELKALSFGLMVLPVWLTVKEIKNPSCNPDGSCPKARDTSFKENDMPYLFVITLLIVGLTLATWNMLRQDPIVYSFFGKKSTLVNPQDNKLYSANTTSTGNKLYDEVVVKVLPEKGFQSKIYLADSVFKLVEEGVIDQNKFEGIYKERRGLPTELVDVLNKPSYDPILLTRDNANIYVNLLWPLGLANYMATNRESPVNGKSLFNFASTGGWNIGKEENGGAYFNKFNIVKLTPEQEALAIKIAQNSYRPCCNNSTFFQDCNHGSALLGVLELGAAQGLTENELYREALAFNSFWFSSSYIQTALYLKAVKNIDWENADPKAVLDKEFSSASGNANIQAQVAKIPNLIPPQGHGGGGGCGT